MKAFHIPIWVKLLSITLGLLILVACIITFESANRFENISKDREEQANRDQSRASADEVEGVLLGYIDKVNMIASLLMKDTSSPEEKEKSLELTFRRDKDLVAVEVLTEKPLETPLRVVNEDYLKQYKRDKSYIDALRRAQASRVHVKNLFHGKDGVVEIRNSTLEKVDAIEEGVPLFTIGFPLAKDDYGKVTHVVLAEIRLDRLQKVFAGASERSLYLVDNEGNLLAHPEEKRVLHAESFAQVPVVKKALESEVKQGKVSFVDEVGQKMTAGYTRTALGVTAIAVVPDDVILEAARAVKRQSLHLAGQILSIALFFIFVFAITLTAPIESLAELTARVAKGDFSVQAKVRSHDEVGQLGRAFNEMIQGLVERDKVKNMFSKFHGSSVTEDLMKGDLSLGGSKKMVTVFFSDVRDFTKFSEGHTPEEVVEMLNEYFQIMVGIINANGGVVDKFIGDAIMAVWGAPNFHENDSQNAVKAALQMRTALAELNEKRAGRGKIPIKIGMGMHRGDAISGTIGSSERMEYTVIGDTVNQASRIESSTKAFGTDLLLSEEMAAFVEKEYIVEVAGSVEVKGKSEPLKLFKVRGYYDENKQPVVIQTPFSDYEAGDADKVKMAS